MTFVSTAIYHRGEIWNARKGYYDPDDKKTFTGFKGMWHNFFDNFKSDVHSITKESARLVVKDIAEPVLEETALPLGIIAGVGLGLYYLAKNI